MTRTRGRCGCGGMRCGAMRQDAGLTEGLDEDLDEGLDRSPAKARRAPTPCHSQRIAHRGACGKTPVVPQNRRPKPEPAEIGRVRLVSGGFDDRRDRCRRRTDRLDAGRRVAAARRAACSCWRRRRSRPGRPRARPARAQHRGDGPARSAGAVPRARQAVPGRRLLRRHRQAVAGPAGHRASVRPRHPAAHHRPPADRARRRARRRDPARLRTGRAEPGRRRGDRRAGRRHAAALALPRRLRRRPQHGAQAARRRLPRRARQGRDAAGRDGGDRAAGDGGRRGGRGPQDPAAVRRRAPRGRGVPRRRARRGGGRGPHGPADPRGVQAAAAGVRRHRLRRALAALAVPLRRRHPAGRALPGRPGAAGRRRGARPPADRRAGPQPRHPGRVQPRLEAGRRGQRLGAGGAAGQLPRRTAPGGRRRAGQHPRADAS